MVWCKILALLLPVVHVYASIYFETDSRSLGKENLIKNNFHTVFSIKQFFKDMKLTVRGTWWAHLFNSVHDATYFQQHKA
jgi:hypothetical protein